MLYDIHVLGYTYVYIYIYIYIYVYVYIYIYMYREREIHTLHIHIHIHVYMYVYKCFKSVDKIVGPNESEAFARPKVTNQLHDLALCIGGIDAGLSKATSTCLMRLICANHAKGCVRCFSIA